tara:strand:+ start:9977 stop:10504 length:528 start_codon:yes stop_codon:yes gene_type:complete
MLIAGIDPGTNGAIAVLDSESPDSVALLDLKKQDTWYIQHWLYEFIDILMKKPLLSREYYIWIEDVHSMHGMSAKSNFGFGKNVGMITTIAELLLKDSPHIVTPKVWQKYIGVTVKGKSIKKEVAKIAQGLYPNAELHGKRGGLLDGRADALMIAHYGLKHWEIDEITKIQLEEE